MCLTIAAAAGCGSERSRRARAAKAPPTSVTHAEAQPPVEAAFVTIADDPVRARLLAAHVELVVAEMTLEEDVSMQLERASQGLGVDADEAPATPEPNLATASELVSMLASIPSSRSVLAPIAAALSGKAAGGMAHVTAALSASVGADLAAAATLHELDDERELADNDLLPLPEARVAPKRVALAESVTVKPVDAPPNASPSAATISSAVLASAQPQAAFEASARSVAVPSPREAKAATKALPAGTQSVGVFIPMPLVTLRPVASVKPVTSTPPPPAAKAPVEVVAAASAAVTMAATPVTTQPVASPLLAAVLKPQAGPGPNVTGTGQRPSSGGSVPEPLAWEDELGRIAARVKWERDELELIYQDTVDVARADDPDATSAENTAYALCMTAALAKQGSFEQLRENRDHAFDELERDGTRGHCTAAALADGSDHADARVWEGMWTKRQRSWMTTRCARDAARIYGTSVDAERTTCECLHNALAKRMSLDKLLRLDDQGFARMIEADAQLSACLGS